MKLRILLADDVEQLAEAVGEMLIDNNFEVDVVYNGKKAFKKVTKHSYDCIILDVMMPEMNGLEVVKNIRKLNIKTPIILLTAKSQVEDKVEGLDLGADDYLTKPFNQKELLARIRALTRREEENREKFKIGNIVFNKEKLQISKGTTSLNLNSKEGDILEIFIKNSERKISGDEFKQRLWNSETSSENIVPMYMTYLQEKFTALNANVRINDINGYTIEKF